MDQKLLLASLFYATSVYYGVLAHIPSDYVHLYISISAVSLALTLAIRFGLL
jgi:hypothetical protein